MKADRIRAHIVPVALGLCCFITVTTPGTATAQPAGARSSPTHTAAKSEVKPKEHHLAGTPVEIAEAPSTIDPAALYPGIVCKPVDIVMTDSPCSDLFDVLRTTMNLNVWVNSAALSDEGISTDLPLTLNYLETPLYIVLDRLADLGMGWYVEENLCVITSILAARHRLYSVSYSINDLTDAGFDPKLIVEAIVNCTPVCWRSLDPVDQQGGTVNAIGEVVLVRQSFRAHHQISGLLAALRRPARRTFTFDAPGHQLLRQKLNQRVEINFTDIPMKDGVEFLAQLAGMELTIDVKSLSDAGISPDLPLTFHATNIPLHTLFENLFSNLGLSWRIHDGLVWITSPSAADEHLETAVYDVRDLCQNHEETSVLLRAMQSQTGGKWRSSGSEGGSVISPKPGVVVVCQTGRQLDEILRFLENYRAAIRQSNLENSNQR